MSLDPLLQGNMDRSTFKITFCNSKAMFNLPKSMISLNHFMIRHIYFTCNNRIVTIILFILNHLVNVKIRNTLGINALTCFRIIFDVLHVT